mmetsp:Transcript_5511/g.12173  ORF Transcript_5511/g.12173 Transcript_5511/m.12173 type:complete len:510 (-) Transcript_5511:34-1563(-)
MGCGATIHRAGDRWARTADKEPLLQATDVTTKTDDSHTPNSLGSSEVLGKGDVSSPGGAPSPNGDKPVKAGGAAQDVNAPIAAEAKDFSRGSAVSSDAKVTSRSDEGKRQPIWGGCRVRTVGLQEKPEWNGLIGTALIYDSSVKRWKVLMPDSSIKMVKPENLTLYSMADGSLKPEDEVPLEPPAADASIELAKAAEGGNLNNQAVAAVDENLRHPGLSKPLEANYDEAVEAGEAVGGKPVPPVLSSLTTPRDDGSQIREEELTQLLERFDGNGRGVVPRATLVRVLQAALPGASRELLEATIDASGAASTSGVEVRTFTRYLYAEAEAAPLPDAASQEPNTANAADPEAQEGSAGQRSDWVTVLYDDGSEYRGQLSDDQKRHGYGIWKSSVGAYEGQFFNDTQHGYGVQSWTDGRMYEGHFRHGKYDGQGKMTWTSGAGVIVYEGEYRDDLKHGRGVFTWADGRSYDGQWKWGRRDGSARYTFKDGTKKLGHWIDDKFERWEVGEDLM